MPSFRVLFVLPRPRGVKAPDNVVRFMHSEQSLVLIAACTGGAFFFLSWWLPRSEWWNQAETLISKRFEKSIDKELSFGIRFRLICALHNILQCSLCLLALSSPILWIDRVNGYTALSQWIVAFSLGFFLWDITTAVQRISVDGSVPIVHGLACVLLLASNLLTGELHFYGVSSILWEFSTPFVHFRWFLYKLGLTDTNLYLVNGTAMTIAFGLSRILWGTYLALRFIVIDKEIVANYSTGKVYFLWPIFIVGMGLNYYWFIKILIAVTKHFPKRERIK